MTDRELLEAAARATGYEFGYINDELRLMIPGSCGTWGCTKPHSTKWNPLRDDGDALRLAVKLGLNVSRGYADSGCDGPYFFEADGDQYSATRRAIVRAAAALGADK